MSIYRQWNRGAGRVLEVEAERDTGSEDYHPYSLLTRYWIAGLPSVYSLPTIFPCQGSMKLHYSSLAACTTYRTFKLLELYNQ